MSKVRIQSFASRLKAKNAFDGNLVYGARKFHHDTSRTGKGKPASGFTQGDLGRIVRDTGKERYQRHPNVWEEVNVCPVCGSKSREYVLSRFGLDIYRCVQCTQRYLNPRVKYKRAMELYDRDVNSYKIYSSPTQIRLDKIMYTYAIDLVTQLQPPATAKILDLGCGSGTLLNIAHQKGWERCIGVDVNKKYATIYHDTPGVQFIQSSIESIHTSKLGKEYDCVMMWEMLEHVYDLDRTLNMIKKLLKKKGLLMIKVPNVLSLATRLMREMSPTFSWKHVSYFSTDSLTYVMKKHGLKTVFLENIITEIDNIKSYMSGEYPYYGYGDPEHLFDFITPEYLYKRDLGSRILAVFRKT